MIIFCLKNSVWNWPESQAVCESVKTVTESEIKDPSGIPAMRRATATPPTFSVIGLFLVKIHYAVAFACHVDFFRSLPFRAAGWMRTPTCSLVAIETSERAAEYSQSDWGLCQVRWSVSVYTDVFPGHLFLLHRTCETPSAYSLSLADELWLKCSVNSAVRGIFFLPFFGWLAVGLQHTSHE